MKGLLAYIGGTPLVPLERLGLGLPVPLLAKCEHLNPGGSVKDRIAKAIVDDAEARGILRSGMTLIEATAGNTGVGLALMAAARGYHLVCVMPEKMSVDKRQGLSALGARVVITPNAPPASPDNFQRVAERGQVQHVQGEPSVDPEQRRACPPGHGVPLAIEGCFVFHRSRLLLKRLPIYCRLLVPPRGCVRLESEFLLSHRQPPGRFTVDKMAEASQRKCMALAAGTCCRHLH